MITNNIEDNRDGKFFKIGQNNVIFILLIER
jgi:hypothetical protein